MSKTGLTSKIAFDQQMVLEENRQRVEEKPKYGNKWLIKLIKIARGAQFDLLWSFAVVITFNRDDIFVTRIFIVPE